jgi:hypothetical protein
MGLLPAGAEKAPRCLPCSIRSLFNQGARGASHDYQAWLIIETLNHIASVLNFFPHFRCPHILYQFRILLLTHKWHFLILPPSKSEFLSMNS